MCSDSVLAMACSEDSELLATGCKDGTIKVRTKLLMSTFIVANLVNFRNVNVYAGCNPAAAHARCGPFASALHVSLKCIGA